MCQAFPKSRKWLEKARLVGTAIVAAIRQVGFDVFPDPTSRFPNHARIIHPDSIDGFVDENLKELEKIFQNTKE